MRRLTRRGHADTHTARVISRTDQAAFEAAAAIAKQDAEKAAEEAGGPAAMLASLKRYGRSGGVR